MKKKTTKEEVLDTMSSVLKKITKLDIDLGRGDLNLLRDKLNEVIEYLCQ